MCQCQRSWCGLAAVDTLGADLSVEAGAVIQACRRVLAERARSCCKARSTTESTTESAVYTAQVRYRGRTRHQRRRNFATYDSSQRDWLVREGREDEAGAGWQIKHNRNAGSPMLQGPSFCQLIFGGKTSAVLPHGSVEHDVHLNFTESHWQSTESMFSFVQFLEKVLNPTDEQRPWILLLDCASVHTASAFRQQLHSQLPWVKSIYIPGGSTAYNQPLDRSMMKGFKSAIARKASRHFAEQILLVDSLDLSARFLKPVIATWVHEVINDISS